MTLLRWFILALALAGALSVLRFTPGQAGGVPSWLDPLLVVAWAGAVALAIVVIARAAHRALTDELHRHAGRPQDPADKGAAPTRDADPPREQ